MLNDYFCSLKKYQNRLRYICWRSFRAREIRQAFNIEIHVIVRGNVEENGTWKVGTMRQHSIYSLVNGSRQGFFGCVRRKKIKIKNNDFLSVGEKRFPLFSRRIKKTEREKRNSFNKNATWRWSELTFLFLRSPPGVKCYILNLRRWP